MWLNTMNTWDNHLSQKQLQEWIESESGVFYKALQNQFKDHPNIEVGYIEETLMTTEEVFLVTNKQTKETRQYPLRRKLNVWNLWDYNNTMTNYVPLQKLRNKFLRDALSEAWVDYKIDTAMDTSTFLYNSDLRSASIDDMFDIERLIKFWLDRYNIWQLSSLCKTNKQIGKRVFDIYKDVIWDKLDKYFTLEYYQPEVETYFNSALILHPKNDQVIDDCMYEKWCYQEILDIFYNLFEDLLVWLKKIAKEAQEIRNKEWQEYVNSPEYDEKHVAELKRIRDFINSEK